MTADPPAEWSLILATERRSWWSGRVTDRKTETIGGFASSALAWIAADWLRMDGSYSCRVTVVRVR